MTLTQAILLGGYYWLYTCSLGYGFGNFLYMAVFSSMAAGFILGDVVTAMKVGAVVQPLYLAFTNQGGTMSVDQCAAGLVATAVVVTSGGAVDVGAATTVAIPVALLCAQLHTIRRIVAATWVHMADKYAEQLNFRGITMCALVYNQLVKIVIFWLPMSLAMYFGASSIATLMENLPTWLTNGLTVVSKLLPALGFAMTVNVIGRKELLPFFFAGFFFAKYTGAGNMPLTMVGLFLAFLYMTIINVGKKDEESEGGLFSKEKVEEIENEKKILNKKDVFQVWVRWWWACEQTNSFERLQSLAVCFAMMPALRKLYAGNDDELRKALQRHLIFFNTEGIWGSIIHGIALALEEQKAMGLPVNESIIISVKNGLMGPFAGIGDTIDWSTVRPLFIAFFLPYAAEGFWWAAVCPWLLTFAFTFAEGTYFTRMGYSMGTRAAMSILESGQVQTIITFAAVLGLFMMGGLSATMVSVQTPIVIWSNGSAMSVQADILDNIVPGLLTVLTVYFVYRALNKGSMNMMKMTFILLAVGLVLGALGILGDPVAA